MPNKPTKRAPKSPTPELPKVHQVYDFLLSSLDLETRHRDSLNSRGFSDAEIKSNGYRTLPIKRGAIVDRLARQFNHDLSSVPGFWRNTTGGWELAGKSGILIPIRDTSGVITGLKVRVDKPSSPSSKYLLLSSNPKADNDGNVKYPQGTSAQIAIHFPSGFPKRLETLRITEGELKADIATSLTSEYTISIPGVAMWRMAVALVKELKPNQVLIAFDSDKDKPVNVEGSEDRSYGGTRKEFDDDFSTAPVAEDYVVGKALASLYLGLKEAGFKVAIEDWPAEAGKGIDDVLISGNTDQIRRMEDEEAETFARELLAADLPEDWVYIIGTKRFYNTKTLIELDKEQFRDQFCHEEKGDPALKALKNPAFTKVDLPIYVPSREPFFKQDGKKFINLWRPNTKVTRKKGSAKKMLDHIAYLFPEKEEQGIVLDWLAFQVQNPGVKILWAMLIQGEQGTGKSYLGWLMRALLGEHNVSLPDNEQIHEVYTAWQKSCQLVVVEEIMARGRLELMNKLKPIITQDITTIREMNKPHYQQPNHFNLLMFTNYEDAILLDKTDRRYCVLFSPAKPLEDAYYRDLWDWSKANTGILLDFMLSRDLSKFDPLSRAPMTSAKREVIEAGRSPLHAWLEDAIENEAWPFLSDIVSSSHLLECLPRHLAGTSLQGIGKALKALGAQPLGQVKLPSGMVRLLSIRRHEMWRDREADTLAAEYLKWSTSAQPGGHAEVNPLAQSRPI